MCNLFLVATRSSSGSEDMLGLIPNSRPHCYPHLPTSSVSPYPYCCPGCASDDVCTLFYIS
jgi:hypothetical protein